VQSGRIRFVLLRRIGEAFVTDEIPSDALEETLGRLSVHV
jgi:3-dehydroquinate synthetase